MSGSPRRAWASRPDTASSRPIGTFTDHWTFPKSFFDPAARTDSGLRRRANGEALVLRLIRNRPDRRIGTSLKEQDEVLLPEGVTFKKGELAFFPIERNGFRHPVEPPDRVTYNFDNHLDDGRAVVCPATRNWST